MRAAEPLRLFAAGSLKAPLTEIAETFAAQEGVAVEGVYGPSGLLRTRIEGGEAAALFAAANLEHPQALTDAGLGGPLRRFAGNRLVALLRPGLKLTPGKLLDTLLDSGIALGTSTPGADPSGDYAWALFGKAEALRPGAESALQAKARQLTGGPGSEAPPAGRNAPGRNAYAWILESGRAEIFLTYRSNALAAQAEVPALGVVETPPELAVGAAYGLTVLKEAPPAAEALADAILSHDGQAILARHGFEGAA